MYLGYLFYYLRFIVAYLATSFVHVLGEEVHQTRTGTSRRSYELTGRTNH